MIEETTVETLEEAQEVIVQLCELIQVCFDTIGMIDNELEEGREANAQEIIHVFYSTIEQAQGNVH